MTMATLVRKLTRLEGLAERTAERTGSNPAPLLARLRADRGLVMSRAGLTPDRWQRELLYCLDSRLLLLASRQAGKSRLAAALALNTALLRPRSLVLLLSPTLRQSGELFRDKLLPQWRALGQPERLRPPTQLELELRNGSRVVSLPENEAGIRGFSGVALLVIDEAARVSDGLYKAVRPMLATSRGRLLALSSPCGKRGWFHEAWQSAQAWRRVKVTAEQCPRISAEFLAEERQALGERWFRQEYFCSFEDAIGAVFADSDIAAALAGDLTPLFAR